MPQSVLLVDDTRMFLDMEREFLRNSPIAIHTASNGVEALDLMGQVHPDLVFMDLLMPKMDGASCCRAVKSNPVLSETPVVLIMSAGNPEAHDACTLSGCDDVISKPLDRDMFLDVARKYLPVIERREVRVRSSLPCELRLVNMSVAGTLHDLSVRGAYVASKVRIAVKEVIRISFCLTDGTPVVCFARVCWINKDGSALPQGFGVEFALLPKPSHEALIAFVHGLYEPRT